MARAKFIQIAGVRMDVDQLEKAAKREALREAERLIDDAARAIEDELNLIIKEMLVQSSKNHQPYLDIMGRRKMSPPAASSLYVKVTVTGQGIGSTINVQVLDKNKGEDNVFNKLDQGSKGFTVKPGQIIQFPRYKGNIISTGKQRPIGISVKNVKYGSAADPNNKPVVRLFGRRKGVRAGFKVKGFEPRNLYNRVLITLRNSQKQRFQVSGANRNWVMRYIARTALKFSSKNLIIKVRTS